MDKTNLEPTPSNSRFHSQSVGNNIKISIDKVRLVGDLNLEYLPLIYQSQLRELHFNYKESASFSGFIASSNNERINFEFNHGKALVFKSSNIWFEFNPNKLAPDALDLLNSIFLPYCSNMHVTRADIAFDVKADMANLITIRNNAQKSAIFFGANGRIETRYFGSRQSDKYIRIYDKKRELLDKFDTVIPDEYFWRIEIEAKRKSLNHINTLLDGIDLLIPAIYMLDDVVERAMILYLVADDSRWSELSKNTKTKYKKLMKSISANVVTDVLRPILNNNSIRLVNQLNSYLTFSQSKKELIAPTINSNL